MSTPFKILHDDHVTVDQELCIGCEGCIELCPVQAIEMTRNGKAIINTEKCQMSECTGTSDPECMTTCPVGAIYVED